MYAIVEIQGQQFKAEAGKFLYVHYLGDEKKEGETVEFDRVLLVDADGDVKVGAPTVEGAKVVCEVAVPLVKGDKVIVFKKKRRKGYRRKNGHRQCFSKVVIKEFVAYPLKILQKWHIRKVLVVPRTAVSQKANDLALRFLAVRKLKPATLSNVSVAQFTTRALT